MKILSDLGKFEPAQIQVSTPGSDEASLTQSREIGDGRRSIQHRGKTTQKEKDYVTRPWAHFVAGGYLSF